MTTIKIIKQTAKELGWLYFLYGFVHKEYVYGEKVCFIPQAVIEAGAGLTDGILREAYALDGLLKVMNAEVEVEKDGED